MAATRPDRRSLDRGVAIAATSGLTDEERPRQPVRNGRRAMLSARGYRVIVLEPCAGRPTRIWILEAGVGGAGLLGVGFASAATWPRNVTGYPVSNDAMVFGSSIQATASPRPTTPAPPISEITGSPAATPASPAQAASGDTGDPARRPPAADPLAVRSRTPTDPDDRQEDHHQHQVDPDHGGRLRRSHAFSLPHFGRGVGAPVVVQPEPEAPGAGLTRISTGSGIGAGFGMAPPKPASPAVACRLRGRAPRRRHPPDPAAP